MSKASRQRQQTRQPDHGGRGNRLFHYTEGERALSILRDGHIKLATDYIAPNEKAACWFSFAPVWEATANKMFVDATGKLRLTYGIAEMAALSIPVRIEIEPDAAPYDWNAFKRMAGTPSKILTALYRAAIFAGARVSDWRVCFEPVAVTSFKAIEFYDGESKWLPVADTGDNFSTASQKLQVVWDNWKTLTAA